MENEIIGILKKYNQTHILEHMQKLDTNNKARLIEQVRDINFEEITNLYNKTQIEREKRKYQINPINTIVAKEIEQAQRLEYIEIGENILKENKYAVVTMAGGQGTRLRT